MGLLLIHEPGYLGILPMYCFFLLVTPLALHELKRGHVWMVAITSVLIYAAAGIAPHLPQQDLGMHMGGFNFFSWQVLFVTGLLLGGGHVASQSFPQAVRKFLIWICVCATTLFFVIRLEYGLVRGVAQFVDVHGRWLGAVKLAPIRLVNFALFAFCVWNIPRKWGDSLLNTPVIRWVRFLGQHSLPVFAWSVLYTYLAMAFAPAHAGRLIRVADAILASSSLTIPAFLHAQYRQRFSSTVFKAV